MDATQYLQRIKTANPMLFVGKKITITQNELERLVTRAFQEGFRDGEVRGKASKSLFEMIFGS